jgi:hypothetical protein
MYDFIRFWCWKSIVIQAGTSGNYNLRPVIRVSGYFGEWLRESLSSFRRFSSSCFCSSWWCYSVCICWWIWCFSIKRNSAGTYDVTLTPEEGSGKAEKLLLSSSCKREINNLGDVWKLLFPSQRLNKKKQLYSSCFFF